MTIKRTFTRAELEDLGLPHENYIHTELVEEHRWATQWELIFRTEDDGPLWRVDYFKPATEEQECDTWGYGTEPYTVEAVQVEPYAVEAIRYRPVQLTMTTAGPGGWPATATDR